MVNGFRTIHPVDMIKDSVQDFCVGAKIRHETLFLPICPSAFFNCEYNNEDENNSPNILSD